MGDLVAPQPQRVSVPLPVAPSEYVFIQGVFPLTEAKWDQMQAVLEAMKPALVLEPERAGSNDRLSRESPR
jgi:hypothetical protein